MDLTIRPRRLRTSAKLRKMVRETRMDKSSLVYPMFVMDGENKKEEIPTMPGQFRYTLDRMPEILQEMADSVFRITKMKWEAEPMPVMVLFREHWRRQRKKCRISTTSVMSVCVSTPVMATAES